MPLYDDGFSKPNGVHPKTLMTYLLEEGLMSEDRFIDCESVDANSTYQFGAKFLYPKNTGGLMNLIAES